MTGAGGWADVVKEFEARTNQRLDLVEHPEQVKEPAIAYAVMSFGMRKGRFTGRTLSEFFNASRKDALRARQIINGLDRADLIATYWSGLTRALLGSMMGGQ